MATLQVLQDQYTANVDLNTVLPIDNSVPGSSEGAQVLSQAILLSSSANKLFIEVSLWGYAGESIEWGAALFRGATCLDAKAQFVSSDEHGSTIFMDILDEPGSVGPHTYTVRAGAASGVMRLNGDVSGRLFGGISKCTLTLREIG